MERVDLLHGALVLNEGYWGQVAFIQDEHSINEITKSQGIRDLFIRRSLAVVEQAPPPLPKLIDTTEAMVRQAHHNVEELPPSRQGAAAREPLLRLL
jgi:hypothetical protein